MNEAIRRRVLYQAKVMLDDQLTVREVAKIIGLSKSTIHKDLTEKLKYVNPSLYQRAKEILNKNKSERHLRGGEATRRKYLRLHS